MFDHTKFKAGSIRTAADLYAEFLGDGRHGVPAQIGRGVRNYHKGVDRSGCFVDDGEPDTRQRRRAKARATAKFVRQTQRSRGRQVSTKQRRVETLRRRAAAPIREAA